MNSKNILLIVVVSIFSAATTIAVYKAIEEKSSPITIKEVQPLRLTNYNALPAYSQASFDFTYSAAITTPGVVHVQSKMIPQQQTNRNQYNPFRDFFGDDFWGGHYNDQGKTPQPRLASGSGVIISSDGYIVTNNHVIKGSDEIEVMLNDNNKFIANLVGIDPSTDIALLKIDATDLPYIPFGNSDSLQVGAWVLAVGNPFNLSSTVTAGIVSAKGRNINILQDNAAIESFIQTDAAVNPGNSGGALVDVSGKLMGINTAIASPTGAYAGYSFAVPANLVKKVIKDLKDYGIVQRGFLGVTIRNIDSELAKELNTENLNGVYIDNVLEKSAADDAGLKSKDIIKVIDGVNVNTAPQLQEVVAQFRPGDKIRVVYERNGKLKEADIVLKNKNKGTEFLTKGKIEVIDLLGVDFTELTSEEKSQLKIDHGIKVTKIRDGRIRKYTDMREGFVVTKIDKNPVNTTDDVVNILQNKTGGVMIEGIYSDYPGTYYYAFGL